MKIIIPVLIVIHQSNPLYPFDITLLKLQVKHPEDGIILHSTFTRKYKDGYSSLGFAGCKYSNMKVYMKPDQSSQKRIMTTSEECFCFREVPDPPLTDEYLLSLNIGWHLIIEVREELERKWTLLYEPIAAELQFLHDFVLHAYVVLCTIAFHSSTHGLTLKHRGNLSKHTFENLNKANEI